MIHLLSCVPWILAVLPCHISVLDEARSEPCPDCRGKGIVPTEEGRDLMVILKATGMDEWMPDETVQAHPASRFLTVKL